MDEVGRGTTVEVGIGIAYSTVDELYTNHKCRALFATHYHNLVDILGYTEEPEKADKNRTFANIGFFCNDIEETEVNSILNLLYYKCGRMTLSHGLLRMVSLLIPTGFALE
jgi:DNA mismatch repair ATPase MutS